MTIERHIVDNRVFLLGLGEIYREAMKENESGELLGCARRVASVLSVSPEDVPVEGYYSDDNQLAEYFLFMQALQEVPESRALDVKDLCQFKRLKQVTGSRIFGEVFETAGKLFPKGCDPLALALEKTAPNWTIDNLTSTAYKTAVDSDDCSLIGLASLAKDPVAIAALRESVVLYETGVLLGFPPEREFIWEVDDLIAERANRFISTYNELFDGNFPAADAENASSYWNAYEDADPVGRCVRIGLNPYASPIEHYHWAVNVDNDKLIVDDFWDTELWTTARYRTQRLRKQWI